MPEIIITAVFLIWTGIWDFRIRKIPMKLLILWVLAGVVLRCYLENLSIWIHGTLPGFFLYAYTMVTEEKQLGRADALAMFGFAGTAGVYHAYESLLIAFLLVIPVAIYSLMKGKAKMEVPFLPFIGGGYICVIFLIRSSGAVIP